MIGKCFIRLATEVCMGFEPKIEIQKTTENFDGYSSA